MRTPQIKQNTYVPGVSSNDMEEWKWKGKQANLVKEIILIVWNNYDKIIGFSKFNNKLINKKNANYLYFSITLTFLNPTENRLLYGREVLHKILRYHRLIVSVYPIYISSVHMPC